MTNKEIDNYVDKIRKIPNPYAYTWLFLQTIVILLAELIKRTPIQKGSETSLWETEL